MAISLRIRVSSRYGLEKVCTVQLQSRGNSGNFWIHRGGVVGQMQPCRPRRRRQQSWCGRRTRTLSVVVRPVAFVPSSSASSPSTAANRPPRLTAAAAVVRRSQLVDDRRRRRTRREIFRSFSVLIRLFFQLLLFSLKYKKKFFFIIIIIIYCRADIAIIELYSHVKIIIIILYHVDPIDGPSSFRVFAAVFTPFDRLFSSFAAILSSHIWDRVNIYRSSTPVMMMMMIAFVKRTKGFPLSLKIFFFDVKEILFFIPFVQQNILLFIPRNDVVFRETLFQKKPFILGPQPVVHIGTADITQKNTRMLHRETGNFKTRWFKINKYKEKVVNYNLFNLTFIYL